MPCLISHLSYLLPDRLLGFAIFEYRLGQNKNVSRAIRYFRTYPVSMHFSYVEMMRLRRLGIAKVQICTREKF